MRTKQLKILVIISVIALLVPLYGGRVTQGQNPEQEPFFSVVLTCPSNNPVRIEWAQMIAESFKDANIDARVELGDVSFLFPLIFAPAEENVGKTFDEGGWDILFVAWSGWFYPSLFDVHQSGALVPYGYNYILWEDWKNDLLINQINAEIDDLERGMLLKEWQLHFQAESPRASLHYPNHAWAYDPNLENFEEISYLFPVRLAGDPRIRFTSDGESFAVAQSANPYNFNPIISDSYFDLVTTNPCYETLFTYTKNEELFAIQQTPALTTGPYEVSPDGRVWTIHLRDDIYWPTGFRFNASDLYLTYEAILSEEIGTAKRRQFMEMSVDINNFEIVDEFTLRVNLPKPYAWARNVFNVAPISYAAMRGIHFEEWRNHPSNTGQIWTTTDVNGNSYSVYGPLGLGPYVCHEPDTGMNYPSQSFMTRRRDLVADFGSPFLNPDPGYFNGPTGWGTTNMPETYRAQTMDNPSEAIAALEAGTINLIDSNFMLLYWQDAIDPAWGTLLIEPELNVQEMGYNLRHPVFGSGVATPLGQKQPERAAEAARYVRQALNYLIPRQRIIDELLNGQGDLGVTWIHPLVEGFDPTVQPYQYDPNLAAELLAKAGYGAPLKMDLKLSGNFDYPIREAIPLQIAALLTDHYNGKPVSGATVTFWVHNPEHQMIFTGTLEEQVSGSGVYLYQTSQTLRQLDLDKGIYLIYAKATVIGGVESIDMIQFHIDPPGGSSPTDLGLLSLLTLGIIGVASVVLHGFLVLFWLRRRKH